MLKFSDLNLGEDTESNIKLKKATLVPNSISLRSSVIDLSHLKKRKPTKEELKELHTVEPGYKIPVANYQQVGTFCDKCDDVTGHVFNPASKTIICQICKTKRKTK